MHGFPSRRACAHGTDLKQPRPPAGSSLPRTPATGLMRVSTSVSATPPIRARTAARKKCASAAVRMRGGEQVIDHLPAFDSRHLRPAACAPRSRSASCAAHRQRRRRPRPSRPPPRRTRPRSRTFVIHDTTVPGCRARHRATVVGDVDQATTRACSAIATLPTQARRLLGHAAPLRTSRSTASRKRLPLRRAHSSPTRAASGSIASSAPCSPRPCAPPPASGRHQFGDEVRVKRSLAVGSQNENSGSAAGCAPSAAAAAARRNATAQWYSWSFWRPASADRRSRCSSAWRSGGGRCSTADAPIQPAAEHEDVFGADAGGRLEAAQHALRALALRPAQHAQAFGENASASRLRWRTRRSTCGPS